MAKKKVTLWVEPEYADKLEALARLEGLAVSQYGAVLLMRAIKESNDKLGLDLLETRLKLLLAEEFRKMTKALNAPLEFAATQAGMASLFIMEDHIHKYGEEATVKRRDAYQKAIADNLKRSSREARKIERLGATED